VPASIPVVALAFVYHNIVPVVTSSLEGDLRRVRTALVTGTSLPSALASDALRTPACRVRVRVRVRVPGS